MEPAVLERAGECGVVGRDSGEISGRRLEARYERIPGRVIENTVKDLCVVGDIGDVGV